MKYYNKSHVRFQEGSAAKHYFDYYYKIDTQGNMFFWNIESKVWDRKDYTYSYLTSDCVDVLKEEKECLQGIIREMSEIEVVIRLGTEAL